MRRIKALLLLSIILIPSYILAMSPPVRANVGYAKVYIICLSDVPCRNFYGVESHTSKIQVEKGAIKAIRFREDSCLPTAHPMLGKTPPYYGISYQNVTEWSSYEAIVNTCSDCIIINTHGEILPIPYGYSNPVSWMSRIADAMLKRRVTWVHTGGYPFYRVWYQGATQSVEWSSDGTYGFKNFTSYINLNGVTCWPSGSETEPVSINASTKDTLVNGWPGVVDAFRVERGRPLKVSDFKNYTIMRIWDNNDGYMTGAVISFVKPSERVLPANRLGFGAYVHIGTNKTFKDDYSETDGDCLRGYVGAAAAITIEVQAFNSVSSTKVYTSGGYTAWGLAVTPVISYYYFEGSDCTIKLSFGVYGCIKTNIDKTIWKMNFYLSDLPEGSEVMVRSSKCKNGYNYGKSNIFVDAWEDVKLISQPFLFIVGALATDGLELIVDGIGGTMLFSDYMKIASIKNNNGVDDAHAHYIDFDYKPEIFYTHPGDGYTYGEFESIIYVELTVPMANRQQWTIIPMKWSLEMYENELDYALRESGSSPIAVFTNFNRNDYNATVFFEDCSDISDWAIGDLNPLAGYDYWGIPDDTPGYIVWCAYVGNNSLKGEMPNKQGTQQYDKDMNAYMQRQVDFRPYRTLTIHLRFYLCYVISAGDYLAIEYYENGYWHTSKTITGDNFLDHWDEITLPSTAEQIRFRFYSNDDNNVGFGVVISDIEIIAEMPNDANTNHDAGNNFANATSITLPNSYGAYLNNYDEDWYMFYISAQNIADGKIVSISMDMPEYTIFKKELYNPNNQTKCIDYPTGYPLSQSDIPGWWRLRIYPIMGFGPYGFRIELQTGSGGGCPVLLIWNGSNYVDYGFINIHNVEEDVVREVSVAKEDVKIEGFSARFKLREGWEGLSYSHSLIDQVKLYAIDKRGNRYICPLIKAIHSEQGNVLLKLLFSDNQRTDTYLKQTIDLQFLVPYPEGAIQSFIFVIEGHNPEKIWE